MYNFSFNRILVFTLIQIRILLFTLIRILLFTSMPIRIRILPLKMMRIGSGSATLLASYNECGSETLIS